MKIALCYSGYTRTYHHCVKNHASLIGEADVYFSTWDNFGFSDNINDPHHVLIERIENQKVTEDYILKNTPENLKVKGIKIEKQEDIDFKEDNLAIKRFKSQYYKIKSCYDLLLNSGIHYDFVVRIRPDITIENLKFTEGKIIFNEYVWYQHRFKPDGDQINEMIWVAEPHLMEKSCRIIENFDSCISGFGSNSWYGEFICRRNLIIEEAINLVETHDFNYRVIR